METYYLTYPELSGLRFYKAPTAKAIMTGYKNGHEDRCARSDERKRQALAKIRKRKSK